jgi:hypothetical protein
MGLETIALIGLGVAAAGAGASAHEAHVQDIHAGQARRDAQTAQNTLLAQAQEEEKQQAASQAAEEARKKQRQQVASAYGRASTILTGPEGLGGGSSPLGAGA